MSISDGMSSGAEYADFEVQEFALLNEVTPGTDGDNNPNQRVLAEFEPLEDRGGLSANEVAELVYLETIAYIEIEDENADQDVGTTGESRGYIGLNSQGDPESLNSSAADGGNITIQFTDQDVKDVKGKTVTDQGRLQPYALERGLPFDDQTNGPGGNSSGDTFHAQKHMRNIFGRGPVLDVTDNICIFNAVNVSDTIITVGATTRCYAVWDTAEVDEAGREFSLPQ